MQPGALDSHAIGSLSKEELQEFAAIEFLRNGSACRKCFLMVKRKCHPSMRKFSLCRVQMPQTVGEQAPVTHQQSSSVQDSEEQNKYVHEYYMARACEILISKLEKLGTYCYSREAYQTYVEYLVKAEEVLPRCKRSFDRYLMANYKLVTIRSTVKGKGICVMTPGSAVYLLTSSSKTRSVDYLSSPTLRQSLMKIASLYHRDEMKKRFQSRQWNIGEEIKRFPPEVWRYFWIALESPKNTFERGLAEDEVHGEISHLSWPFSNGPSATTDEFQSLSQNHHRKCLRIFSALQHLVFCSDGAAAGPFVWGLSICALLHGSKSLLTLLNTLRYTKSYDTMQRLRKTIESAEQSKELKKKLVKSLLLKVPWDNLDARVSSNVVRLVGKKLDWHGTVMISTQMPNSTPLISSQPFRTVQKRDFPTPVSVMEKFVTNTPAVRSFNVIFAGLIAVFRQNLFSKKAESMVSIDFLLRLVLKGNCEGTAASISNLLLADMISNSE